MLPLFYDFCICNYTFMDQINTSLQMINKSILIIEQIQKQQNCKTRLRFMIFPTDYRQRLIKEEKSRQYKAMLDQQIRQNHLYNQQSKHNRRHNRIRTQPIDLYQFRNLNDSSTRELQHESTFLPIINPHNPIDHTYKYYPSPDHSSRNYLSNLSANKYGLKRHNGQDAYDPLEKCLNECDQLIYGINKNFINLNNHFRNNSSKRRVSDSNHHKYKYSSSFDLFKDQDSRISRGYDNLPVTSLKTSQFLGLDSDVGRNEMMNYNLLKQKSKQKEIIHISTPSDQKGYSLPEKDSYEDMQKSGSKTKRKNIKDVLAEKLKSTPNKNNNHLSFDTINSDDPNEFTNINLPSYMSSQLNQSIQKMKEQAKKIEDQLKLHEQMKQKSSKIVQHLRKAKNRGNILFKKIQVFRKQREDLQKSDIFQKQPQNRTNNNNSNLESRNGQKKNSQSKNSQVSQTKLGQASNSQDISSKQLNIELQKGKNQSDKKLEPSQMTKESQKNSRVGSKLNAK